MNHWPSLTSIVCLPGFLSSSRSSDTVPVITQPVSTAKRASVFVCFTEHWTCHSSTAIALHKWSVNRGTKKPHQNSYASRFLRNVSGRTDINAQHYQMLPSRMCSYKLNMLVCVHALDDAAMHTFAGCVRRNLTPCIRGCPRAATSKSHKPACHAVRCRDPDGRL